MAGDVDKLFITVDASIESLRKEFSSAQSLLSKFEKDVKNGLDNIFSSFNSKQATTSALTALFNDTEAAYRRLAASIDPVFAAEQRLAQGTRELNEALRLGIITQDEFTRRQVQLANAINGTTAVANRQNGAYTNLGYQVQDVFASFASGINPLVILAQQGGQTASALTNVGGVTQTVARFIAGPWGAAILGGAAVLGLLSTKTKEASKSTLDQINAVENLADATELLTKISGAAVKTKKEEIALIKEKTAASARETLTTLENAKAYLKAQKAKDAARGLSPQAAEIYGGSIVSSIEGEISNLEKISEKAGKILRSLAQNDIDDRVAAKFDKAKAATLAYEAALEKLKIQHRDNKISDAEYQKQQEKITKTRDDALELARAERRKKKDPSKEIDDLYNSTIKLVDPIKAATEEYKKLLDTIDKLAGAGRIQSKDIGKYKSAAGDQYLSNIFGGSLESELKKGRDNLEKQREEQQKEIDTYSDKLKQIELENIKIRSKVTLDTKEQLVLQREAVSAEIDNEIAEYQRLFQKISDASSVAYNPEAAQSVLKIIEALREKEQASLELLNTEAVKERLKELKQFSDQFAASLTSAFEDAILSGRSLGDIWKGLEKDILRLIIRLTILKPLAESISNSISGDSTYSGGPSSSSGSILNGISAIGSAIFGGGGGGTFTFANGGRPPYGRASLVGERGPELFIPDSPGTIVPNHVINGSRGGQTVYNISVDARAANDPAAVRAQVYEGIRQAAPIIEQRAVASTIKKLQRRTL